MNANSTIKFIIKLTSKYLNNRITVFDQKYFFMKNVEKLTLKIIALTIMNKNTTNKPQQ